MGLRDLITRKGTDIAVRKEDENPFVVLQREINNMFDNFFRGFDLQPFDSRSGFVPKVDVSENDTEITVVAELPGMDENNIDVSICKDTLTIKGEKKEEKQDKGDNYYRMERSFGSFCRTIALPADVEIDKTEAKFKNGVLTVKVPKSPKAVKDIKKIAIKSE